MTQPEYVPLSPRDQVRPVERLQTPGPWWPDRPAEIGGAGQPAGPKLGSPGPDQGFALGLAWRLSDRLGLTEGETADDAVVGCLGVALRRAALFGRAPVIFDCEHAFTLWGFMGSPPPDLVEFRRPLFQSASHDYPTQRAISDMVPDETLRLTPATVAARLPEWRGLIRT